MPTAIVSSLARPRARFDLPLVRRRSQLDRPRAPLAAFLLCAALAAFSSACSGNVRTGDAGGSALEGDGGGGNTDGGEGEGDDASEAEWDGSVEGGLDGAPSGNVDSGPFSCMPTSCEAEGATCGRIDDRCGAVLLCGSCGDGKVCDPGTNQCVEGSALCDGAKCGATTDACDGVVGCGSCAVGEVCRSGQCEVCTPRACAAGQCGKISDGCGGTIDCLGCGDGQVCDAVTRTCGTCDRTSCLGEGVECGTISDGCGGTLTCGAAGGSCAAGNSCQQGKCLPTPPPAECEAQGKNCGTISHACTGADVSCGVCAPGETCLDNVCTSCVPTSCAEKGITCGQINDGCGGTLRCGDCADQEMCHQGSCCKPTSCAEQGKTCGTLNIGCGLTQDCGKCDALNNQVCGQGGVANVCGTCTPTKTCQDPNPNQSGEPELTCGNLWDGCKTVRCGTCDPGSYCKSNECLDCPTMDEVCTPGKCGTINTACGPIVCPGCPDGQGCGAAGVANVCGTCPTDLCLGKNCGTRKVTGCEALTCGPPSCSSGQTCGGGGVANVCGACTPNPNACAGRICGTVWNGCANQDCGPGCAAGQRCLASGTMCKTPSTCANHPGKCGSIDDGAGGQISCGCEEDQVCTAGTCCQPDTCQDHGGSIATGCVVGPTTNFADGCGGIIQCALCDGPILN